VSGIHDAVFGVGTQNVFMQKCTCFPLKPWHLRVITKLHDVIVSLVTDVKGEVQPITDHEDPVRSGSIAVLFFNLTGVNTTTQENEWAPGPSTVVRSLISNVGLGLHKRNLFKCKLFVTRLKLFQRTHRQSTDIKHMRL